MDPLANLSADHVQIALALDAIDNLIARSFEEELDLEAVYPIADFIERWADGVHYAKEELLFEELARAGIPRRVGPTAFLEMEHASTRAQTARVRAAIAGLHAGRHSDGAVLLDALARYAAVVRVHLPKEELGYFRMAAELLDARAKARLAEQFARLDAQLPASFAQAAAALTAPGTQAPAPQPAVPAPAPAPAQSELERIVGTITLNLKAPCVPLQVRRRR